MGRVKNWVVRKVWPLVDEATRPAVQETARQVLQELVPGAVKEAAAPVLRQLADETLPAATSRLVGAVEGASQAAVKSVETAAQAAVLAAEAAGTPVLQRLEGAAQAALQAAEAAAQSALSTVQAAGANALQAVQTVGTSGLQSMEAAGANALQAVESSGAGALQALQAAGATALQSMEAAGATALQSMEATGASAVQSVEKAGASAVAAARTAARQAVESAEAASQRGVRGSEVASQRAVQRIEAASQQAMQQLEALARQATASIEAVQRSLGGQLAFTAGHASLLQQLVREKEQWQAQDVPAAADLPERVRALVRKHAGLATATPGQESEQELLAELRFLWTNSALVRPMLELAAGRRVLYAGQCYYNLWYLSRALRERGWKADLLNWDGNPASQIYYHGEDFRFNGLPDERVQILRFYVAALYGYDVFHFANMGGLSFGWLLGTMVEPELGRNGEIHLLKALGKKIVYTNNGCHDGVSQTSFARWGDDPVCAICRWRDVPEVCSDAGNLEWGRFRNAVSDYQCLLGGNRVDCNDDPRVHESPWAYCLDPQVWRPDLEIPPELKIERRSDRTLLLYHAVGNKEDRTLENGVNIKSSHVYQPLIEKLRGQGWDIDVVEPVGVPNREVRFLQLQADIFLDMLTYGWFGANAREAMMLGKPVVCYIRPEWLESLREEIPDYAAELPIVTATPETVEGVLVDLMSHPDKRAEIGRRSREFMLRWHSSEAAARQFESIYTRLVAGDPLLRKPTASVAARRVVELLPG